KKGAVRSAHRPLSFAFKGSGLKAQGLAIFLIPDPRSPSAKPLLRHPEAVERAFVGPQVDPAVHHGNTREVVPALHLFAARPELLAGERVERVDRRVGALRGADR